MASRSPSGIPDIVTLPCDLTQWPVIKEFLLEAGEATDSDKLIASLDKAQSLVQRNEILVDPKAKKPRKCKNIFQGWKNYLDNQIDDIERNVFFNVTLPCIILRAIDIEFLKPEDGLKFIKQNEATQTELSRRLVASIVACAMLALFPGRAYSKHSSLCGINYSEFYNHISNPSQRAKLTCILKYFEKIAEDPSGPEGSILFARQVVSEENLYSMEMWMDCDIPLCQVQTFYPPHTIEDAGSEAIQVDFANKKIGGAVLVKGAVQEEIRFCTCPELQASMLFMEEMLDNEAIVIQGIENYTKYKGYSRTLQCNGIYEDKARRNSKGNLETTICAIDAQPSRRIGGAKEQYKSINILREINKAYAGFSQSQALFEPVPVSGSQDTGHLCPPTHSGTPSAHSGSPSAEDEFHSAVESLHEDEFPSSLLANYTSNLTQTILSEAVEKSAAAALAESPVPTSETTMTLQDKESSDFSDLSSRDERRRSSNMSNMSSSSASGKRSSSEFSSEFEEYYEAFQQRERKVKHIVIQEEVPGGMETDSGVRVFPEQASFQESPPRNITRPAAVRPQLRRGHSEGQVGKLKKAEYTRSNSAEQNVSFSVASSMVDTIFTDVMKGSSQQPIPTAAQQDVKPAQRVAWGDVDQIRTIGEFAVEKSSAILQEAVSDAVSGRPRSGAGDPACPVTQHSIVEDYPSPEDKISASLYVAISRMAENMVNEGFKVVKEKIKSDSEKANEPKAEEIAPELLEKIEGFADKLVSHAMKSAVTIGASHLATRRRAIRAKRGSHGGVSREMFVFADNFVQEILHEALCFVREQIPLQPKDRNIEESWIKPLERQRTNSFYFQAEFSSNYRGSIPNLRRRESGGSYRRGSFDERIGRRRASSSGFRDSVLSDFEDELNRSNVSSPGLQMLLDFNTADQDTNGYKRRASEPANSSNPEFEFASPSEMTYTPLKKRACSVDCSSSREVVLDWLCRNASASTTSLSQKGRSKSRSRTNSYHLDWYAQDLLVDAFNDAFIELFGRGYTFTQDSSLSSDMSSQSEVERSRADSTRNFQGLNKFAISLAKSITTEACEIAAKLGGDEEPGGYQQAGNVPYPELEAAADQLAKRVMAEALDIARSEWAIYSTVKKPVYQRPIATGNWGCGAYKGDPQLKSLIQWAAASRASTPVMWYHTFGNDEVKQLPRICEKLVVEGFTVGRLLQMVNHYCQKRCSRKVQGSLFDYIMDHLKI